MEKRPPPTIPALHFDSGAHPERYRFEAWRTAIAAVHATAPGEGTERDALSVQTTVWNLGGLVAAHGHYSAQKAERNTALIRRSGAEGYRLHLTVAGSPVGIQTGEDRRLVHPGEIVLIDLARPSSQLTSGPSETIVLYLSRPAVEALVPQPSGLHGLPLQGALATLLREHTKGLVEALQAPDTPAAAAPVLAQATLQLLAAAASGAVPPGGEARRSVEDALRRRVCAFIDEHLLELDLSQERICRVFHMSRATLYRLLQPLGGVASYVQERRLARIHAALLDPAHHHHIGRLAESHGFTSQTHMSRVYRARYGVSPSETGAAPMPTAAPLTDGEVTYRQWLRTLGA